MVRVDLKEENGPKFIQLTNRVLFSAVCNHKIMADCENWRGGGGASPPCKVYICVTINRLGKAIDNRVYNIYGKALLGHVLL